MLKVILSFFLFLCVAVNAMAQFESNPLSQALDITEYNVVNDSPGWRVANSSSLVGGDAAISSIIGDGRFATMSIAYIDSIGRGGKVSFDWRITNASLFDELIFIVSNLSGDALQTHDLSIEKDWESVTFDIPSQDVILSWVYSENGDFEISSLRNGRAWVDNVKISQNGSSLPPECRTYPTNLNSALDNGEFAIGGSPGSGGSRFICELDESARGGSVARSPLETGRFFTFDMSTVVEGPIDILFDWRIDAGSDDSFELSIDFNKVEVLNGVTQWATKRVSIPEGEHFVRWRYFRRSLTPTNLNAAYVDYLRTAEFTNIRNTPNFMPSINLLLED